jgi:hypothetical protein
VTLVDFEVAASMRRSWRSSLLSPLEPGDTRSRGIGMNSHARSLMFLFGMAPLGLGCSSSKADGDDDDRPDDTGETGSTGASGDGSTTDAGGSTADAGGSTTDDGGMTDDGGSTDGGTGDLCEDYAAAYANCYDPDQAYYSLEWCEESLAFYQEYGSPACFAAWQASVACRTAAECFDNYQYYQCEAEFLAQIQACYYDDGVYNGCDLIDQMVGGCISPGAGQDAEIECDQTYDSLYNQHGGGCGDAFLQMMVCISKLDCEALSNKQYVYDNCEPEIVAKNQACQ